jgi:hypothetical protein
MIVLQLDKTCLNSSKDLSSRDIPMIRIRIRIQIGKLNRGIGRLGLEVFQRGYQHGS